MRCGRHFWPFFRRYRFWGKSSINSSRIARSAKSIQSERKNRVNAKTSTIGLIGAGLLCLLLSGCAVTPTAATFPEGNVRRLLQSYPQEAEKARVAAPAFTRDALKTISGLEEQIAIEAAVRPAQ